MSKVSSAGSYLSPRSLLSPRGRKSSTEEAVKADTIPTAPVDEKCCAPVMPASPEQDAENETMEAVESMVKETIDNALNLAAAEELVTNAFAKAITIVEAEQQSPVEAVATLAMDLVTKVEEAIDEAIDAVKASVVGDEAKPAKADNFLAQWCTGMQKCYAK